MKKFLIPLFFLSILFLSCSDDMEMEEEMEASVDITTLIKGSYGGDIKYSESSSFFTEDDRTATVTTVSDSIANIGISSISGTITLVAMMNSETDFVIDNATIYDESPFNGFGTVMGDSLLIELNLDNKIFEFKGEK